MNKTYSDSYTLIALAPHPINDTVTLLMARATANEHHLLFPKAPLAEHLWSRP